MKRFPITRHALLIFALGLGVSAFVPTLHAITVGASTTWTGATSNDWTVASNWSGGVPAATGVIINPALFDGSGPTSIINATFNGMEFDSGSYTINFIATASKGKASSPIVVNAGTQTFNGVTIGGAATNGGTIFDVAAGATVNINNALSTGGGLTFGGSGTINVSGSLSSTSTVTKSGTGTTTLNGTNNIDTGSTIISGGKYLVNGLVSSTSGTFSVTSGGTLGGFGTINKATTIATGGTLAPGVDVGVLTFGGALTLASGSLTNFEIDGTTRGTDYDGLTILGQTSFGGTLTLDFGDLIDGGNTLDLFQLTGGVTPSTSFDFVTGAGSYTGSFSNSGGVWTLASGGQTLTFDQSTGDLTVTGTAAVPEPATDAEWIGAAILGMAAWRRRGKRSVG